MTGKAKDVRDIREYLKNALRVKAALLDSEDLRGRAMKAARVVVDAYRNGGKVLLCGNGGSAADAQHLAAELTGRFAFDRPPLDAEALHCNGSHMTAVANDYTFDHTFARLIQAKGKPGDILMAFSTSGTSCNILRAVEEANNAGMYSIGFTGENQSTMDEVCSLVVKAPSRVTSHIQEVHITIGHYLCGVIEEALFGCNGNGGASIVRSGE